MKDGLGRSQLPPCPREASVQRPPALCPPCVPSLPDGQCPHPPEEATGGHPEATLGEHRAGLTRGLTATLRLHPTTRLLALQRHGSEHTGVVVCGTTDFSTRTRRASKNPSSSATRPLGRAPAAQHPPNPGGGPWG